MKSIVAVLLVLSLTACADSGGKDKNNSFGDNKKVENVTDYGVCGEYSPTSIEGRWVLKQRAGEFNFIMAMYVANGYVHMSNFCELHGRHLTASVSSPASYDSMYLETYANDEDVQEINEPGFHFDCRASIKKSRIRYSFRGKCLQFTENGQTVTMVPY